ncbi:MAG: cation-translocating P-type ATPase, partial [Desulfobia sp.]
MNKPDQHPFYSLPAKKVLELLQTDSEQGLSTKQAEERLKETGPNKFRRVKSRSGWRILFDQFKSMVIIVLVIAGAVAFTFQHWAEGVAILAVILINAGIGFVTEWKAVRSMEALRAIGKDTIRVRREGREFSLDAESLVPGDIVILEGGDFVPADIRLIESNSLRVNESALTGESVPGFKDTAPVSPGTALADRTCMVYRGTTLTQGSGQGVVTATGMQSELGRISELAATAGKEATPLQKRLDQLGRRLAWITISIAVVIAAAGLLAGQEPAKMIETAIALGVAAIPEGLPIVATLALARGMVIMAQRNALINRLPAVETLGATQVIFTDKTGTLTENQMTLRKVLTPDGNFEINEDSGTVQGDNGSDHPLLLRIIEVGVLCNNAALQDRDGDRRAEAEQGDPTETALLRAGLVLGMERESLLRNRPEEREVPFDAETMMMATFHQSGQGLETMVKGAPSRVLDSCRTIADPEGEEDRILDEEMRAEWEKRAHELAGQGLRVLAMADKNPGNVDENPYEDLRFLGLVGL